MRNGTKNPKQVGARALGRPRSYDPDAALARVRDAFWERGFAGTSLDQLSAATGMQRPSLYGAFGDKSALFASTLARYAAASTAALESTLTREGTLRESLQAAFDGALAFYTRDGSSRGCFLVSAALTEAPSDERAQTILAQTFAKFDRLFEQRFRAARAHGDWPEAADEAALSQLATAVLHTLAVRARAGGSRGALQQIANAGVDALCGRPAKPRKRRGP